MKNILYAAIIIFLLTPSILQADTIHVPGDEPTIQDAVDSASDGDTILVADGTWDGASVSGLAITIRSEYGPSQCIVSHLGYGFEIGSTSSVTIDGFTITGDGYGVYSNGFTTIENCLITENGQGGIQSHLGGTTIRNCEISWNVNDNQFGGGGIHAWGDFTADNCLFHHNAAWSDNPGVHGQGGAIWCTFSSPTITNCTFYYNYAENVGSAIATSEDHAPAAGQKAGRTGGEVVTVENCIIWQSAEGEEVYIYPGATLAISYSTIYGGQDSITGSFTWGDGMIEDDPLFVSGDLGDYFLSQTAAGQAEDSPCVDAGNPSSALIVGTTRTDFELDAGIVDMGWHYGEPPPPPEGPFLVAGPGPEQDNPNLARVFPPEQGAAHAVEIQCYGPNRYGVNVATGDVDGDGTSEIITGPGPGAVFGPHVRGFDPLGTSIQGISFFAYGTLKYGVNVACGDLDGDGHDDMVTGAGPGAIFGTHVRAFAYDGTAVSPVPGVSYFAYGAPEYGVNVAAGDIDGDGYDEIVTGPGPGTIYGPHVRGWDVDGGTATDIPGINFFAYGTHKKGVRVAAGDVDGDGIDEILTSPGPSDVFGAHIRGWNYDGDSLDEIPGIHFFAWSPAESLYGATVSSGTDLDGDGRDEIIAGQGPDTEAGTVVRVYSFDGDETTLLFDIDAFGDEGLTHGINAVAGSY